MDAGLLRERITIESEGRVANGQGGFTTSWSAMAASVSASIVGLSGDEALRAGVERAVTQYRVVIRKRADVSPKNRLQWNGQVMAVRSVMPHPSYPNSHLLMICETAAS